MTAYSVPSSKAHLSQTWIDGVLLFADILTCGSRSEMLRALYIAMNFPA
jgi:hypothetical protein